MKHKLIMENWRKFVSEVDTDNDGIPDEKELAVIDRGEIQGSSDANNCQDYEFEIRELVEAGEIAKEKPDSSLIDQAILAAADALEDGGDAAFNCMTKDLDPETIRALAATGLKTIQSGDHSDFYERAPLFVKMVKKLQDTIGPSTSV